MSNKKIPISILRKNVKTFLKSHHPSFCKPVSKLSKKELIDHLRYLDTYANFVAPEKKELDRPKPIHIVKSEKISKIKPTHPIFVPESYREEHAGIQVYNCSRDILLKIGKNVDPDNPNNIMYIFNILNENNLFDKKTGKCNNQEKIKQIIDNFHNNGVMLSRLHKK